MKVVDIDYNNHNLFDKLVKKNYNFVKFYHPDCHYCKAMSNTWNTLPSILDKNKYNNLNIVKVHANAISDINSKCSKNIMGFPTIMMVKPGGNHYEEYNDERDITLLKNFIDKTYKTKKSKTKTKTKKSKTKTKTKKSKPKK